MRKSVRLGLAALAGLAFLGTVVAFFFAVLYFGTAEVLGFMFVSVAAGLLIAVAINIAHVVYDLLGDR